jgi:hypothetical protein
MAHIILDDFIEAFAAHLVNHGQTMVRLRDPTVRDGLFRVFQFLEKSAESTGLSRDKDWHRSLVRIRNVFRPSPIGSFDRFETLLRAKQVYLTDHPNRYYQDIVIKLPKLTAEHIVERSDRNTSQLAKASVEHYLAIG